MIKIEHVKEKLESGELIKKSTPCYIQDKKLSKRLCVATNRRIMFVDNNGASQSARFDNIVTASGNGCTITIKTNKSELKFIPKDYSAIKAVVGEKFTEDPEPPKEADTYKHKWLNKALNKLLIVVFSFLAIAIIALSVKEALPKSNEEIIAKAIAENFVVESGVTNYIYDEQFNTLSITSKGRGYDANSFIFMSHAAITDTLKAIKDIPFSYVDFNIIYTLVDTYGNERDDTVLAAGFSDVTIAKINYDNFNWDNIPLIADSYWSYLDEL